ncbi:subtilisin sub7 [Cystoisospora suis]|uniref:subtilisin n=1 Tax=Cystoisospora suis TaxID=483139 RepID=A0A2C6LBQ5_9APIC|nr:subtilisin sub7 [Cystoisospora suis]
MANRLIYGGGPPSTPASAVICSPTDRTTTTMGVLRSFLISALLSVGCFSFLAGVAEVTGSQVGPDGHQYNRTLLLTYLPECMETNEGRLGATERALKSTYARTAAKRRGDTRYAESVDSVPMTAQVVGEYEAYSSKIISFGSSSSSDLRRPEQFFEDPEDQDDNDERSGAGGCQVSEESLRRVGVDVIDLGNCVMLDSEDLKDALETDPCIASVEYDQEISLDSLRPSVAQQLSLLDGDHPAADTAHVSDDQKTNSVSSEDNNPNSKTINDEKVEASSDREGTMSAQQERRGPLPPPPPSGITDPPNYWRFKSGLDDSVYAKIDCQPDRVVAVIDTGITYDHPALAKNVWINKNEIPGNGIDDDKNGFIDDVYGFNFRDNKGDPYDDHGHGTHVAGIIGAVLTDSNSLVKGVCGRTSIAGLKFMGANGNGSTSDAIKALNYAVQMKIPLSCNSWGGPSWSEALIAALEAADAVGHLFVAAAGNQGRNTDEIPHYPASYKVPNVISVAATTSNDELAPFSNRGPLTVDLAAPGVKILSTFPPNRFKELSGTSMATPVVAGVAALLMSFPYQEIAQIKRAIVNGVDKPPAVEGLVKSSGRVNARKAVTWLSLELGIEDEPKRNSCVLQGKEDKEEKEKEQKEGDLQQDPSRKTTMRDSAGKETAVETSEDHLDEVIVPITA